MLLMTLSCGVDKNHYYVIPDTRAKVDINVWMEKLIFKDYAKGNLISRQLKKIRYLHNKVDDILNIADLHQTAVWFQISI